MTPLGAIAIGLGAAGASASALGAVGAYRKGLDRWLPSYLLDPARRRRRAGGPVELILCVADHFEPRHGGVDRRRADDRVDAWVDGYAEALGRFRDSGGRPPRHTFFFPMEVYDRGHVGRLAGLCRRGFGEVEVHLHHDRDNGADLRRRLARFAAELAGDHGMLARPADPAFDDGRPRYGFVHGNWALDNSRPDGRWCGVDDELDALVETGCYADFTLPSAPSRAQTRKINRIYDAVDDPCRPMSHARGVDFGAGPRPPGSLALIQGPLGLDWSRPKWGFLPRVENGCLQAGQPPTIGRVAAWLDAGVGVAGRPDWVFAKLHTHGAPEANRRMLLGEPGVRFHRELAAKAAADPGFRYHYVSAREMYNLARAAAAGWAGDVGGALDFELIWNGAGGGAARPAAPAPAGALA